MYTEKFISAYYGTVSEATLAFRFPAQNKANVIRYLTERKEIDKYIIVDEEEEAKTKAQQAAILAKFAVPMNERMDVTIENEDQPKSKRK